MSNSFNFFKGKMGDVLSLKALIVFFCSFFYFFFLLFPDRSVLVCLIYVRSHRRREGVFGHKKYIFF